MEFGAGYDHCCSISGYFRFIVHFTCTEMPQKPCFFHAEEQGSVSDIDLYMGIADGFDGAFYMRSSNDNGKQTSKIRMEHLF